MELFIGGVALHFIGTCYLFVGLYIVCEDYFVKSLEEISRRLKLSQDVAGEYLSLNIVLSLSLVF